MRPGKAARPRIPVFGFRGLEALVWLDRCASRGRDLVVADGERHGGGDHGVVGLGGGGSGVGADGADAAAYAPVPLVPRPSVPRPLVPSSDGTRAVVSCATGTSTPTVRSATAAGRRTDDVPAAGRRASGRRCGERPSGQGAVHVATSSSCAGLLPGACWRG